MSVALLPVDEDVLARLTAVATTDAAADEVTPPLTDGPAWTPERTAWFESYHRRCRDGLSPDASAGEQTWAIAVDGAPAGAVRLQRTDEPGVLEVGVWLARRARGRGASVAAVRAVVEQARRLGARGVVADTSETNLPAQALLRRLGFTIAPGEAGRVTGRLGLS